MQSDWPTSNRYASLVLMATVIALTTLAAGSASDAFAQYGSLELPAPAGSLGNIHRIFSADSPPGVVGAARLQRWGAVGGYYQPVAFRGPESTAFSLAVNGVFNPPVDSQSPLHAGLLIGAVYRFKITSIPGYEGEELFPTVEVIDRTYPPHHLAARYPIPINLELADLIDAMAGRLVTRVIYLEDPTTAIPLATTPESAQALDIPSNQDPLHVADSLGKPVAIVRLGSLGPPSHEALLPQFFFGFPPWVLIHAQPDDAPVMNDPGN
jgi:hypothetical protein